MQAAVANGAFAPPRPAAAPRGALGNAGFRPPHAAPDQPDQGFRERFPAQHRTTDGHLVRSRAEVLIDNWNRVLSVKMTGVLIATPMRPCR